MTRPPLLYLTVVGAHVTRPPLLFSLMEKLLAKGAKLCYLNDDVPILSVFIYNSAVNGTKRIGFEAQYKEEEKRFHSYPFDYAKPEDAPVKEVVYTHSISFDEADVLWTLVKKGDCFILKQRDSKEVERSSAS